MAKAIFTLMKIDPKRYWPQVLPGWKMRLSEVSNGHYEVLLTDDYGRQAGTSGIDPNETSVLCEQYALDIEKQISKNFSKFLFDVFILKLKKKVITDQRYNYAAFGSWLIEVANKRVLFDGKEDNLIFEDKEHKIWTERSVIKTAISTLTIKDINELVVKL